MEVVASEGWVDARVAAALAAAARSLAGAAGRALVRRRVRTVVAPELGGLSRRALAALDDAALAALVRRADAVGGGVAWTVLLKGLKALTRLPLIVGHRCAHLSLDDCPRLRGLSLGGFDRLESLALRLDGCSPSWVAAVLQTVPLNLKHLDLVGATVGLRDAFFAETVPTWAFAPALRELHIAGMKHVTLRTVRTIDQACPNLEVLGANACDAVDWTRIDYCAFPSLRRLDVGRALVPTTRHDVPIDRPTFGANLEDLLARNGGLLKDLVVDGQTSGERLTRRTARAMFAAPPLGTPTQTTTTRRPRVVFFGVRSLSARDVALAEFAFALGPALLRLDVSCARFETALLLRCASSLGGLRHLAAVNVAAKPPLDDAALAAILRALPADGDPTTTRLRHLDVSRNRELTAAGVEAVVTERCRRLRLLRATHLSADEAATSKKTTRTRDIFSSSSSSSSANAPLPRGPRLRAAGCCDGEHSSALHARRPRDAYHCGTCAVAADDVLCAHCAAVCHAAHETRFVGRINMTCDCDALCPKVHVPYAAP